MPLAIIVLLAFASMIISLVIVSSSKGFATAVNQAGTLRMQSYRIAASLAEESVVKTKRLAEEFEERLNHSRLVNIIDEEKISPIERYYNCTSKRWHSEAKPMLETYYDLLENREMTADVKMTLRNYHTEYLDYADRFVQCIDKFVMAIEVEAEDRLQLLRVILPIILVLTVIMVMITYYQVRNRVVRPLGQLMEGALAAMEGDFSTHIEVSQTNELGQLSAAFNSMAENLSSIYQDLEKRIQKKTFDLERTNRSLETLYETTRELASSALNTQSQERLTTEIEKFQCVNKAQVLIGSEPHEQAKGMFHFPIMDRDEYLGTLLIETKNNEKLEDWQQRLLETIAQNLSSVVIRNRQTSQQRLLALMDERGVIARELHDSLAQSLSYLKIQVASLQKSVQENNASARDDALQKLQFGINSAYRELRELLTTFRLRHNIESFSAALEDIVEEFSKRGKIEILLENLLSNVQIDPNVEIHLVQIIREALTNVLQHAQATQAKLRLERIDDANHQLSIEDNGIGITNVKVKERHYGLTTMGERSEELGGEFSLQKASMGGTKVVVRYPAPEGDED